MIIVDFYGQFYWKPKLKFLIMPNPSSKWFKTSFMSPLNLLDQIMVMSLCFHIFMHPLVLYTINLVLKLLNKMLELRENTSISSMLAEPFFSNPNFHHPIGHMTFFMHFFSSIESLLMFYKTNPHFKSYTTSYLTFPLLRCLDVCLMLYPYRFIELNFIRELENPSF